MPAKVEDRRRPGAKAPWAFVVFVVGRAGRGRRLGAFAVRSAREAHGIIEHGSRRGDVESPKLVSTIELLPVGAHDRIEVIDHRVAPAWYRGEV